MSVYVRWYGKVLEGELLEGDWMGMKQVRIPLDGHRPVALFYPGHVYESRNSAELMESGQRSVKNETFEIKISTPEDSLPADANKSLEAFKTENWDYERGHLRTDKLDEFYRLWCMAMTPHGHVEAEASDILSQRKQPAPSAEVVPQNGTPKQAPKPLKPSKKILRSTGKQDFGNTVQLSLFD